MRVTKKILQREKLIAELCKINNWDSKNLSPSQVEKIVTKLMQDKDRKINR